MRPLLGLLVVSLLAFGAFAQNAEFGRATGGEISAIAKHPRQTSGTLGLTHTSFGQGYEGSLGGELFKDRLWFFGSAAMLPTVQFDGKVTAQPVDWSTVTASFTQLRQPVLDGTLPKSFLSLRSTSILSERTILSFSASRETGTH